MSEDKSLAEKASTVSGPSIPPAAASATTATPAPSADAPKVLSAKPVIPLVIFGLAIVLFGAIAVSWISWQNTFSLSTDDAYVRADVAPLSTREHGIVSKTFVHDYQKVIAGQLLVELKNDDFKDRVEQEQQSVSQIQIKIDDMKSRKTKLDAQIDDASAQLANSESSLRQFDSTVAIAKTSIQEAQANIEASAAVVKQIDSSIQSATADVVKADASKKREEALLAEESTTKERVEQVTDEHARSAATLEGQNAARLKAKAELLSKKAELQKAHAQLASVLLDREKAGSVIKSKEAEVVSRRMERKLLDGEENQLRSELASKNYATDSAKINLGYTSIKAPVDGSVGELKVKPGQFVNAGTQVVTLISSSPWVVANFREMQTAKIKVGDRATIKVDALPGLTFGGRVESLAPASGAQFSLLPPDNASGNFTKITQRIPVKIVFDDQSPNKGDLSRLCPGMSASVSISQ